MVFIKTKNLNQKNIIFWLEFLYNIGVIADGDYITIIGFYDQAIFVTKTFAHRELPISSLVYLIKLNIHHANYETFSSDRYCLSDA